MFRVYLRTGWAGYALYAGGENAPIHHMSAADSIAHSLFKDCPTRNYVEVRSVDGFGKELKCYRLAPDTHRVDEHGQVRPINRDSTAEPEGKLVVDEAGRLAREPRTIELEPKWVGILPMLILTIQHGNDEGKRIAVEELQRMAKAADLWNAHARGEVE